MKIAVLITAILLSLQSCLVDMESQKSHDKKLRNELPVVVTKKHVRRIYVEGYPQTLIIEYRSINQKYYGHTGKIKTKDAYFFMAIGVGDTLMLK